MKIEDFSYMNQGKFIAPLKPDDLHLLKAIEMINAPTGKALLLLHGFSSSPAVYRELLSGFSAYDAVFCPVLPGHADSIDSFETATAAQWIESAEKITVDILKHYPKLDIMGLSLGGLLGCHLATRFSLNHLYLLAPAIYLYLNVPLAILGAKFMHKLGLRRLTNRAGDMHDSSLAELTYRQLPLSTIISLLDFIKKYDKRPPNCAVDVFLGRHDKVVNSSKVAKLFQDLPQAKIHWLDNSAHVLPLDADRKMISDTITDNN